MHSVTHLMDRKTITALAVALAVSIPATASADDLDVYTATQGINAKPNILLVLDYSGSMNKDVSGNDTSVLADRKITILKNAVNDLMTKYKQNINLGLGSLYDTTPSGVRWPISGLSDDPHTIDSAIPANTYSMSDIINSQMDQRSAGGNTNTVSALADAALYFQNGLVTHDDKSLNDAWHHKPDKWVEGSNPKEGKYQGGNAYSALPSSYFPSTAYIENAIDGNQTSWCRNYTKYNPTGANYCQDKVLLQCDDYPPTEGSWDHDDDPDTPNQVSSSGGYETCEYKTNTTWNQPQYISPIVHECQKNYMILISDGLPTRRTTGATLSAVLGADPSTCEDVSVSIFNDSTATSGNCGAELLHKLATEDQIDTIKNSTVTSYTIGFSVNDSGGKYLDKLATAGKGDFFQANNETQLNDALDALLGEILKGSESFAELSIDLDKASFSNDNRAYFSLFNPSFKSAWSGNVKGYFVNDKGLIDINNKEAVVLKDGKSQFIETAQSFWSSTPDGNEVLEGGAAEHVLALKDNRNLYTFVGNTDAIFGDGENLTTDANVLDKTNSAITSAMLNNTSDRENLLDWIQTAPMGDALHSKVVTADYGDQTVAYVITNQGFLHAIDATTPTDMTAGDSSGGNELFAFMPQELLANLPALRQNITDPNNHIYGLDGQITPIHTDLDGDGVVDDGDKLVLVFGMRRGGNSYYAVDVTKPNVPKLLWQIKGGVGDFKSLAQTWSRMSLISGSTGPDPEDIERVLVFAGGYDAAVVDGTDGSPAASGNAVYVVDLNGDYIWSTDDIQPATGMVHSIPSDVTIIDTDLDNKADRMYVGDTGGNVWRVDFDLVRTKSDYSVMPFANLANAAGGNQPFFYPPSVAFNSSSTGDFLSVSMASGNRTNPLTMDTQNAIYMMRDEDTRKGGTKSAAGAINLGALYNATDNDIASADANVATAAKDQLTHANNRGWYVNLDSGEKGLSGLLSFEGNLMATTYKPAYPDPDALSVDDNVCIVSTGALYIMDIADGRPVKYLADGSAVTEGLSASDRKTQLTGSAIPGSPSIVFPKGTSQVNIFVDKESISTVSQRLNTVFWHSQ